MVKRRPPPLAMLVSGGLAWASLLLAGCVVHEEVVAEGRPCSASVQCGPGTTCDPRTSTCARSAADLGGGDLPDMKLHVEQSPDRWVPSDLPTMDHTPLSEAGTCPQGMTPCNGFCVNLQEDPLHCGKCNIVCDPATSDTCLDGLCRCGDNADTNPPCSNGLNCAGGECRCVVGGRCQGCCVVEPDTDICIQASTADQCGAGGNQCFACSDSNPCTDTYCEGNGCSGPIAKMDETPCNDTLSCTGQGICIDTVCVTTPLPGFCLIDGECWSPSNSSPDFCLVCNPDMSTERWSPSHEIDCVGTEAGTGQKGLHDGPVLTATFASPSGIVVDPTGRIYVADTENHLIRTIENGVVSTFAGTFQGFADGDVLIDAQFNLPTGLAWDMDGSLLVADSGNHAIRRIDAGLVTTVAGGTQGLDTGTVSAPAARFDTPNALAVDHQTGAILVADTMNNRIRRILTGEVDVFAGSGTGDANGDLLTAQFNHPVGIASYQDSGAVEVVLVADRDNHRIRKIADGMVTTLAGSSQGFSDGAAAQAQFDQPTGITVSDPSHDIYVSDQANHRLRKIINDSWVSTVAGSGPGLVDGHVGAVKFFHPGGVYWSPNNRLFICDTGNHSIRSLVLP